MARYAIVFKGTNVNTLVEKTFYMSDGLGFTSSPSATPANTFFDSVLSDNLKTRRDMFSKSTTYGAVTSGVGEISIVNNDGVYDELVLDYATNGRELTVYYADEEHINFPNEWQIVQISKIKIIELKENEVVVTLQDKMQLLSQPLLQSLYLGNNVLPSGTEGVKDDLKGQRKPRVYGKVQNITPLFVNTARLIYQISDKPCLISKVYSRGVEWASETAYTTFAQLQDDLLEPSPEKYKVYSGSEGTYIRVGSIPAGTLTLDANTSEMRCGELLKNIALDAGLLLSEIDTADVAALNTLTYQCGVFVQDESIASDVMNVIASALGAYFSFDRLGLLKFDVLSIPSITEVYTIEEDEVKSISLLSTADTDEGIPAWRLSLKYSKNYTIQDDLSEAVSSERIAFAKEEYRVAKQENAFIKTLYPNSPEITVDTSLINEADALAECTRRLALLQNRFLYEIITTPSQEIIDTVDIGSDVKAYYPRYGLESGKILKCIGILYDYSSNELTLKLWG